MLRGALAVAMLASVLLAACGGAEKRYTSADVLGAWHSHGLKASLTSPGAPAPSPLREFWLVDAGLLGPKLMTLYVADSRADAAAWGTRPGGGVGPNRRYVQANVVLIYTDESDLPYVQALSDLR